MGFSELRGNRCGGYLVGTYRGQRIWATIYLLLYTCSYHTPAKHLEKTQLQLHTAREMLKFPHSLPSSSQRHLRFSKCHAEMFGLFPADCFSGCWLGEICRLPMLRGPSGYSQPCAGAAFLSAHSLCRSSAQDRPAALVSSSALLPRLLPGVSAHVFGVPWDSDQVAEHQLHGVSEAAAPT